MSFYSVLLLLLLGLKLTNKISVSWAKLVLFVVLILSLSFNHLFSGLPRTVDVYTGGIHTRIESKGGVVNSPFDSGVMFLNENGKIVYVSGGYIVTQK